MKQPCIFLRTGNGLVPYSTWAEDWMQKIGIGEEVIVQPRRPRNPDHHRKFWALLTIISQNNDAIETPEQALEILAAILGRGRWIEIPKATRPLFVRESIAYANMDQDEFDRFYEECIRATLKYLVPAEREDIMQEIARF